MPLMKSPAGDMEITIEGMTSENAKLLAIGKFGMWESTIILTPEDVVHLIPLMLKWKVISFMLKLPYLYFKTKGLKKN